MSAVYSDVEIAPLHPTSASVMCVLVHTDQKHWELWLSPSLTNWGSGCLAVVLLLLKRIFLA